jgi:hypothetical protein
MLKFIAVLATFAMLAGCTNQVDRTDEEMLEDATKIYQNYLSEYGIDSALFQSPIVESRQDGTKSYKWLAESSEGSKVGVEVVVSKIKNINAEMILIGDTDAWFPFVGSKNRKPETGRATGTDADTTHAPPEK